MFLLFNSNIIPYAMAYINEKRRDRRHQRKAILFTVLIQVLILAGVFFHGEIAGWFDQLMASFSGESVSIP